MEAYLESNAKIRRRDSVPVPQPRQITIPKISVDGHLHMQETTQIQA